MVQSCIFIFIGFNLQYQYVALMGTEAKSRICGVNSPVEPSLPLPPCKADGESCNYNETDLVDQFLNDEHDHAHPHAQAKELEGHCELMKSQRGLNILIQKKCIIK